VDESKLSELPPGTASPNKRVRGRPLVSHSPPPLNNKSPPAPYTYESPLPMRPPQSPEPHPQHGSAPRRNLAPPSSCYRPPPVHYPPRMVQRPLRGWWPPDAIPRYLLDKSVKECQELGLLVESLGSENEDLKDQLKYQLSSLKEQLKITKDQSNEIEWQDKELKELKTKLTALETKVADKNEEIKELKLKNNEYKHKVAEEREQVQKFKRLSKYYEKELRALRAEMKKAEENLEKKQAEIRLAKRELGKKQAESRKGKALVTRLQSQKKRLKEQVQDYKKRRDAEARSGPHLSFQVTLSEVLDNLDKQSQKVEALVLNCSMQKIEYDHVIEHFISCYRNVHNEFRILRDTQQEEHELKKESTDVPHIKSPLYDRPVNVVWKECSSNFDQIKKLQANFSELSGQPYPLVAPN